MTTSIGRLLQLALIIPLALLLGYVLSNPYDFGSILLVTVVLGFLALPIVLKWHHYLAILSVNLHFSAFFLPGQPNIWVVFAFVSSAVSGLGWLVDKKDPLNWERSIAVPLVLLLAVVMITAYLTGGIGGRALGSDSWGGQKYLLVIASVVAYFAISLRSIPVAHQSKIVTLFLLVGVSAIISNLVFLAGPSFYFLYNFFPATISALMDEGWAGVAIRRYSGIRMAAEFSIYALIAVYGIKGIMTWSKPWRALLVLALLVIGFAGGFRSFVIKLAVLYVFQFYFERLFKMRYIVPVVAGLIVFFVGGIVFAQKLPLAFQRVLTIVPFVEVDKQAELDARGTLNWRLEMWQIVAPEIPRYLVKGKGYSFDGTDYLLTDLAMQRFGLPAYESTLISGNYHSGILTLVIPFGIWGVIFFGWFLVAAYRKLYFYYRTGPPELRLTNTFFLAWFCQQAVHFLVFYGQFELDLIKFTSLVGLSIAVNEGFRKTQTNSTIRESGADTELSVVPEAP